MFVGLLLNHKKGWMDLDKIWNRGSIETGFAIFKLTQAKVFEPMNKLAQNWQIVCYFFNSVLGLHFTWISPDGKL